MKKSEKIIDKIKKLESKCDSKEDKHDIKLLLDSIEEVIDGSSVIISRSDYLEYVQLKKRSTPMKKMVDRTRHLMRCPVCKYVVDNAVPKQYFCDRCGQQLIR